MDFAAGFTNRNVLYFQVEVRVVIDDNFRRPFCRKGADAAEVIALDIDIAAAGHNVGQLNIVNGSAFYRSKIGRSRICRIFNFLN